VAAGHVSPALVYRCPPGEILRLGAPVGTGLSAYRRSYQDLLLIAGGTGLAPLRSIVEDLAINRDGRHITMVVGADTVTGLYDLPALDALCASMTSLTVIPAVVHGPLGPAQRGTAVQVALTHRDWYGHDIYVCGSPNMVFTTRMELRGAGYRDNQIITEHVSYRGLNRTIKYVEEWGDGR
jgi:NAD(P)H-flavin reductase